MRLPDIYERNVKAKKSIIEWKNLNRRELIADDQFAATTNLSTKNFPLISPRPPRKVHATLTAGYAMFASSKLAWVDGTSFVYDGVTKGTVSAGAKSIVELSQNIVIFPDKKVYDVPNNTFNSFGSGTYPAAGSVPDIDYACTLDNRIWGVKDDNIYCCALGDYSDWTSFVNPDGSVNEAGAWQVDTGSNGNFTGIASYKGTNLVFKVDRVWKRYGDYPSNFQFVEISQLGCVNHKSICEVNNILFWLSPKGVVAYTGGVPEVISEDLNENYSSAVAGGDGRRYYISLYNGTAYKLYVYDTWTGVWLQEDTLNVKEFVYLGDIIYALASDNKIYKFNDGTESVSSSFETKKYTEEYSGKKAHSELFLRVDLNAGAELKVYVKYDNGSYTLVKALSATNATGLTVLKVPLKLKACQHFQLKLEGTGEYRIHQLQRKLVVGEDD